MHSLVSLILGDSRGSSKEVVSGGHENKVLSYFATGKKSRRGHCWKHHGSVVVVMGCTYAKRDWNDALVPFAPSRLRHSTGAATGRERDVASEPVHYV